MPYQTRSSLKKQPIVHKTTFRKYTRKSCQDDIKTLGGKNKCHTLYIPVCWAVILFRVVPQCLQGTCEGNQHRFSGHPQSYMYNEVNVPSNAGIHIHTLFFFTRYSGIIQVLGGKNQESHTILTLNDSSSFTALPSFSLLLASPWKSLVNTTKPETHKQRYINMRGTGREVTQGVQSHFLLVCTGKNKLHYTSQEEQNKHSIWCTESSFSLATSTFILPCERKDKIIGLLFGVLRVLFPLHLLSCSSCHVESGLLFPGRTNHSPSI